MTPDHRAWLENMIARVAPRVDELHGQPGRRAEIVARVLAAIVAGWVAQLAAAPVLPEPADAAPSPSAELARLDRSLAALQPRVGPHGVTFNVGPLVAAVRARLAARIEALGGAPAPIAPAAPPALAIVVAPPPEALPFTAGPQLGMFAMEVAA